MYCTTKNDLPTFAPNEPGEGHLKMYFNGHPNPNNNSVSSEFPNSTAAIFSRNVGARNVVLSNSEVRTESDHKSNLITNSFSRFNNEDGDCTKNTLKSSICLDHEEKIQNHKFEHIIKNPKFYKNMDYGEYQGSVTNSNERYVYQVNRKPNNNGGFTEKCVGCYSPTKAANVKCSDCVKFDILKNFKNLERSEGIKSSSRTQASFHQDEDNTVGNKSVIENSEIVIRKLNQYLGYVRDNKVTRQQVQTYLYSDDDMKKIVEVAKIAEMESRRNSSLNNGESSENDTDMKKSKLTLPSRRLRCGANFSIPFEIPNKKSDMISEDPLCANNDVKFNQHAFVSAGSRIGANFENGFGGCNDIRQRKNCNLKKEDYFDVYTELKGMLKTMTVTFDNLRVAYEKSLNQIAELVRNGDQDDQKTLLIESNLALAKITEAMCGSLNRSINLLKRLTSAVHNPEMIGDTVTKPVSEESLNFDIIFESRSGTSSQKTNGENINELHKKAHRKYNTFPGNLKNQYEAYKRGLPVSDNTQIFTENSSLGKRKIAQIFEEFPKGKGNSFSTVEHSFKMTKNPKKPRFEAYTRPKTRNDLNKQISKLENIIRLNLTPNLEKPARLQVAGSCEFKIKEQDLVLEKTSELLEEPKVSRGTKVSQYFSKIKSYLPISEDPMEDVSDIFEETSDLSLILDDLSSNNDDVIYDMMMFLQSDREASLDNSAASVSTFYSAPVSCNENIIETTHDPIIPYVSNTGISYINHRKKNDTIDASGFDNSIVENNEYLDGSINEEQANGEMEIPERQLSDIEYQCFGFPSKENVSTNENRIIECGSLVTGSNSNGDNSNEYIYENTENTNDSESAQFKAIQNLLKSHLWPEGYSSLNITYWESTHNQLYYKECIDLIEKSFNFYPVSRYSAAMRTPPGFDNKPSQNLSNLPTIPWIPINSILLDVVAPRRVPKVPPGFENFVPIPRQETSEKGGQILSVNTDLENITVEENSMENEISQEPSDVDSVASSNDDDGCEKESECVQIIPISKPKSTENCDFTTNSKSNGSSGNGNEGRKNKVGKSKGGKKKGGKKKKKQTNKKNNTDKTKNVVKPTADDKSISNESTYNANTQNSVGVKSKKKEPPKELFVQIQSRCGKLPSLINMGVAKSTPIWQPKESPWAIVKNSTNAKVSCVDVPKCSICMYPMAGPDLRQLSCNHRFHEKCVSSSFDNNGKCPVCRLHIIMDVDFPPLTKN